MTDASRITIDTVYGQMVINRHDTIRGRSLIEYGKANDHPEIELLVELLKRRGKESVAIDVGANFGCFTLAFAPHCQRVIALEPQRELVEMLRESLALHDPASQRVIEIVDCGAGAERTSRAVPAIDYDTPQDFGSVRLGIDPDPEGALFSDLLAYDHWRGHRAMVYPLDEIVQFYQFDRVDLLKIDVEGMEMDVLLGAQQTIEKFHPILYVEYIHSDEHALIAWIKARGYLRVRKVGNNLLADPNPAWVPVRPIVGWPDAQTVAQAWPAWREEERDEWLRLSDIVDRLTVIDELQGDANRACERVQTRIGRSLSERCPHGILLWLECGHCNTHVEGDLPTLLSPAALATLERLAESAPAGCFVEVGVFRGGSLQRLYRISERQGRRVWGFDTFRGLIDRAAVDVIPLGHFDAGGDAAYFQLRLALPRAYIVMGVFPDVLQRMIGETEGGPQGVAFAHVDVDQYQSYKATLAALWPRMASGGIILCDDYDSLHGAQAAVNESAWALAGIRRDSIERTSEGKAVLRKP